MLGGGENHILSQLNIPIFSENGYNGGIMLQWRKRERKQRISEKKEIGRRLPP